MEDRWLSVDEVAVYLGIKRDTVYKWIGRKQLPAVKVGRLWKFKKDQVDRWIRAGQAGDPARPPQERIQLPRERIEVFCRTHGIRRLALFGSVLRDDFRPGSDVDVLVEFQPGVRFGLAFVRLQDELSEILGLKVDLHTPGSLSQYFRDEVLEQAEDLYVAA